MATHPTAGAVIYVKDLRGMTAFYREVCGLALTEDAETYAVLASPAIRLVIHAIPPQIAETFEITRPPELREEAAIKLSLPVAHLATARVLAARLGGSVGPVEREWTFGAMRVCDGWDPEGNVIQLHEPAGA